MCPSRSWCAHKRFSTIAWPMSRVGAIEWWASSGTTPYRLPCCGQTVNLDDVEAAKTCSACAAVLPLQLGPACRDYVPAADLTWPGAARIKLRQIQPQRKYVVRYSSCFVGPVSTRVRQIIRVRSRPGLRASTTLASLLCISAAHIMLEFLLGGPWKVIMLAWLVADTLACLSYRRLHAFQRVFTTAV